jgi:putative DNA primase/helicase
MTQIYQIIDAFKAAMQDAGIPAPDHIITDGKLHRAHIPEHKLGSQNLAYFLHTDGKPNGWFKDFKSGIESKWKLDGETKPISQADRQQFEAAKQESRKLKAQRYEQAAIVAQRLVSIAKPLTGNNHPYLLRKQVDSFGLYRLKNWHKRVKDEAGQWVSLDIKNVLLVPLIDFNSKLWNVQLIFCEPHPLLGRDKDFLRDGRQAGTFHFIGQATDEVVICEGYSTGASLHTATGLQILCAMSAGNLFNVAQAVRAVDPRKKIIIAADNDTKKPGNPGLAAAKKAALAVGGFLAVPTFPGDFNDMANREVQL